MNTEAKIIARFAANLSAEGATVSTAASATAAQMTAEALDAGWGAESSAKVGPVVLDTLAKVIAKAATEMAARPSPECYPRYCEPFNPCPRH